MGKATIRVGDALTTYNDDESFWRSEDKDLRRAMRRVTSLEDYAFLEQALPTPLHQYAREVAERLNGEVVSVQIEKQFDDRVY